MLLDVGSTPTISTKENIKREKRMGIREIINNILGVLKKGDIKALPEAGKGLENKRKGFFARMKVKKGQEKPAVVNNRNLESSLKLFFDSYQEILDGKAVFITPNAYNALTRINALGGNCDLNQVQENELLEYAYSSNRYSVQKQVNPSGGFTDFYHIQTNGYQLPSPEKQIRIYLNCRNENTAELAKWLIYCNNAPSFYLKVDTTEALRCYGRMEKIVIYTTDEQFRYCIELINHVKKYRADLFKDSEKTNPFMESAQGISYTRQPTETIFHNLDGSTQQISTSANRHISTVIKESYMAAAREVAAVDPKIQFLLEPQYYNDEVLYMRNYAYIDSMYHVFLINSMEQKMRYLCMQNQIVIKGINDTRQPEHGVAYGE